MRLINADNAMRMIENSRTDNPFFNGKTREIWEKAHDCALSCVIACHTIEVPTWIPVTERLPEKGEFVLLSYSKNNRNPTLHAKNTMAVGRYEYGMFLVDGCSVKVTHWMPLPQPPKDGE